MTDPHGPSDRLAAKTLQEGPGRPGNLKDALAEVDRLRAENERLRALLEPSVTMTSPDAADPERKEAPPPK